MSSLRELAESAGDVAAALTRLHEAGASPVEAILALSEGRGLSLSDGKTALMRSPAWAREAAAAERLHDELEQALLPRGRRAE